MPLRRYIEWPRWRVSCGDNHIRGYFEWLDQLLFYPVRLRIVKDGFCFRVLRVELLYERS